MFSKILPKEKHPPFMNFMGPGTEVEKRLSLNYKGKRGTKNYFIPSTKSDYNSLEHDLLYWSPNNVIKAYADAKYLKDIRSLTGYTGIVLQYLKRLGIETAIDYKTAEYLLSSINKFLSLTSKEIKNNKENLELINEMNNNIQSELNTRRKNLPQDIYLSLLPSDMRLRYQQHENKILKSIQDTKYKMYSKIMFQAIPTLAISSYLTIPKIWSGSKKLFDTLYSTFIKNTEYEELQNKVDLILKKYDDYLNIIGAWEDAPFYKSLIKSTTQLEGEKYFRPKLNLSKKEQLKAQKKYQEFYNEFLSYAEFMNNKYKDDKEYEPFNLEELNTQNINIVSNLQDAPLSFMEKFMTDKYKPIYTINDIEPIKDIQAQATITNKMKLQMEEILDILSKKQEEKQPIYYTSPEDLYIETFDDDYFDNDYYDETEAIEIETFDENYIF